MTLLATRQRFSSTQQHQSHHRVPILSKYMKPTLLVAICTIYIFVQLFLVDNYSKKLISSRSKQDSGSASAASNEQLLFLDAPNNTFHNFSSAKANPEIVITSTAKDQLSENYVSFNAASTAASNSNHPLTPELELCSRERIRGGHWKAVEREKALYTLPSEAWERSCYQKEQFETKSAPIQDWEWTADDNVPDDKDDCSFASFDVNRFCQLNSNRSIAFLGDSISWQQFNSLNLLIGAIDEHRQRSIIKTNACNESTKLLWMRDNYASARGLDKIIKLSDPDLIVFNRGAHYVNNFVLATELNATLVRAFEWQQDCDRRSDKKGCLLVWRTTAPGFPDCDNVPGPIGTGAINRTLAKAMISNSSHPWYKASPKRQEFHWWDFADQNTMVEDLFQTQILLLQGLRISFIDFYEMAILRPDLHIGRGDCLHYCLPGPFDAVNAVLLHEMDAAAV
uniref:SGNH domain-containing protein n=1 Tax=Pseudo-nitzschia australis TaxID=44445 RepID=A0A7S4AJ74_9STRA|mmetsp:Transcript_18216/g.39712  ORF Transcript_18216/g.39712 Transcript_18216/m.39712 type:complete len:453 (-) Transcript_18216:142-1500(-)|eukprot:CAMPEP_0168195230 /NCGR_PEP_ID=MMETSP0139_2-20121125/19721_1 /TAXON_ID=44445 /ORGANISM="Pseudo-nitzschia australis, Strain 10249 10 AB" /LENGTH=452 /DNA_ID=CAMNT_0008119023 /DNA_START=55 /DNA_END=1413 /DNA_ORIENTATION=+